MPHRTRSASRTSRPRRRCGSRQLASVRSELAPIEDPEVTGLAVDPRLVGGERHGAHDGDAIARGRDGREVDRDVLVGQARLTERGAPDDVAELGRAARVEALAVAEEEVEGALLADARAQRRDRLGQRACVRRALREARAKALEQVAERALAVGRADGRVAAEAQRVGLLHGAVVREDPVSPPELAAERVRVRERARPARLLPDVADREQRLDGVRRDEGRERAPRGGLGIEEHPRALALIEREAPAVLVVRGAAAAATKAREREHDVRRDVALHAEQLAHRAPILHATTSSSSTERVTVSRCGTRVERGRRAVPARATSAIARSSVSSAALPRAPRPRLALQPLAITPRGARRVRSRACICEREHTCVRAARAEPASVLDALPASAVPASGSPIGVGVPRARRRSLARRSVAWKRGGPPAARVAPRGSFDRGREPRALRGPAAHGGGAARAEIVVAVAIDVGEADRPPVDRAATSCPRPRASGRRCAHRTRRLRTASRRRARRRARTRRGRHRRRRRGARASRSWRDRPQPLSSASASSVIASPEARAAREVTAEARRRACAEVLAAVAVEIDQADRRVEAVRAPAARVAPARPPRSARGRSPGPSRPSSACPRSCARTRPRGRRPSRRRGGSCSSARDPRSPRHRRAPRARATPRRSPRCSRASTGGPRLRARRGRRRHRHPRRRGGSSRSARARPSPRRPRASGPRSARRSPCRSTASSARPRSRARRGPRAHRRSRPPSRSS
jgi:hypothetical protein